MSRCIINLSGATCCYTLGNPSLLRHRCIFGFYITTIIHVYTPVNRAFLVRKRTVSRRRFFCVLTTHVLAEIINNNLDRELLYGDCKSFLKMRDP